MSAGNYGSRKIPFQKIFNYRWSYSESALQSFLNRPIWEQLMEKRRKIPGSSPQGQPDEASFQIFSRGHATTLCRVGR